MDISPIKAFIKTGNRLELVQYWLGLKTKVEIHFRKMRFEIRKPLSLMYTLGLLYEIYAEGRYANLKIKDKKVVDVGGYIGESAICFAKMGASKVYSVEAYPQLAELIKHNAALNGVSVRVINACVSDSKSVMISEDVVISGRLSHGGRRIKGISIDKLPGAYLLKINLNVPDDIYIERHISKLRRKYGLIFWNVHKKNGNELMILKGRGRRAKSAKSLKIET
jgi:tRNA G37 N-methylase Trm5